MEQLNRDICLIFPGFDVTSTISVLLTKNFHARLLTGAYGYPERIILIYQIYMQQ